jgi:hypothetical protein
MGISQVAAKNPDREAFDNLGAEAAASQSGIPT